MSCVNTKHLKEDEFLLYSQKVKGSKKIHSADLEILIRQKPNRKILGLPIMPYLSAHYLGKPEKYKAKATRKRERTLRKRELRLEKNPDNAEKINKKFDKRLSNIDLLENEGPSIKRTFGESPSIFDLEKANTSALQMENFLKKKGFFEGKVTLVPDTSGKLVRVVFQVSEGKRTRVRKILHQYSDSTIATIQEARLETSKLYEGMGYDEFLIREEIDRLEKVLQNSGYFRFREQYIEILVNDTFAPYLVDLEMNITPPVGSVAAKRYTIQGVNVISDASINLPGVERDTLSYKGVNYIHFKEYVKLKQLDQKINIYPSQFYSLDRSLKTQRNLANLNMYKYANLRYDSAENGFQAYIYTSPLEKHTTSLELGVAVTQWLPGPFGTLSYRTRNLFRGAEILEVNLSGTIEAQTSFASETNFYQSSEVGINTSLTFPNIAFPTPLRFKFNDLNPKTRLNLGFLYTSRPEYSRTNLNSYLKYSFSPLEQTTWNLKVLDYAIIQTDIRQQEFATYLDTLAANGNNLKFSFGNSIVTTMSTEFIYNDFRINQNKRSRYYNFFLESGGTIWNLINETNLERNDTILGLQYYKFLKGVVDFRNYHPTTRNSLVAYRVNAGVAVPYGSNEALPYEKYFFLGGSNSLRAWRPRRMGPGSYAVLNDQGEITYQFEQPGEVLITGNLEWRFGIFRFIKGALFIDAGNVWRIKPNPAQPGGDFSLDRFYKEIAVGGGYGIRLDFSFLVLRVDAGFKLYDPALPEGERFRGDKVDNYDPLNQNSTLWNIGIGYPF